MGPMAKPADKSNAPEIHNRRARHDYHIEDTLEVGIKLRGTEIKSVRAGRISLQEGYVTASEAPVALELHAVRIDEYGPAGGLHRQHIPVRPRVLLAHVREIRKLARAAVVKGYTIVPLKLYFKEGKAKLLIGVARGKAVHDKREDIKKRDAQREMHRATSRRR